MKHHIEFLEQRIQFSTIKYGLAASDNPAISGVLATTGPGLIDMGAQGVRLFTDTDFRSTDFGVTASGKVFVQNPSLVNVLNYSKQYHSAGIAVTLCIQLDLTHSMTDGSVLVDAKGNPRHMTAAELRSPKVFQTWFETFSKAQISKTDNTSVTKVLDFWEIGNETNHGNGAYWPVDATQKDKIVLVDNEIDSYVDHELIPAYTVLHAIGEPVVGEGFASGTARQFDWLNNQPGDRKHQYSNHVDYLNFHPYSYFDSPITSLSPQTEVNNFMDEIYGDGTVKKPFFITEFNTSDFNHYYRPDPNPNSSEAAEQQQVANDLDSVHTLLLNTKHVQLRCAWIFYYRLVAQDNKTRAAVFYPPPDGTGPYVPLNALYDMFKGWATGRSSSAPKSGSGFANLGGTSVINAIATQKNGDTLVVTDDGVRRYTSKNKLDKTFGTNGFAALSMIGHTAALQGDGSLIVAGSVTDPTITGTIPYHLIATRLTSAGKIDTTFGTSGYFEMADGTGTSATAIALRAGKIVIASLSKGVPNGALVRLDLTGQLDTTFGVGGVVTVTKAGPVQDVSIAKNGAITAMLVSYLLAPATEIIRLTSNGSLDAHFGVGGISAAAPIDGDGMFVNGTGSIDLVGHDSTSTSQVIEHFTTKGKLDTSFADNGIQTLSVNGKSIRGTPIELANGTRYLAGSIGSTLDSQDKHIFVARLTSDDRLDTTYAASGAKTFSSTNVQDVPFADTITDSKIILAAGVFTEANGQGMSQELLSLNLM